MKYLPLILSILLVAACGFETTTNTATTNTGKKTPTATTTPSTSKGVAQPRSADSKWLCIPGKQVGQITATSSEADIIAAYGAQNVVRKTIGLGEGETVEGTVVFPNTPNELIIEWASGKAYQQPAKIRIEKNNTAWKTDQGIGIGTSLDALKRINGKAFKFAGFEWDYAGFTNDWQGGNISTKLVVFLEANNPEAIYPDLVGDGLFSSNHPKAAAAELLVRSMEIQF